MNNLEVPISKNNDAIEKLQKKCIQCGYCKKVCEDEITVARMYEIDKSIEPVCINCGQCANLCPTEAIREKLDYIKLKKLLNQNDDTIKVVSIAPAVRVAIGEEFGLDRGINAEQKIVAALKKLGFNYVFDITFAADLTIMEEAMELVGRIKNGGTLPMFTSCCPAWVKYAEIFYPNLLPNLSSCKSPISMQSALIKTYFAKNIGVNPKKILNVTIAPCTAKKAEIKRPEINSAGEYNHINGLKDTDFALTTRELAMMLKDAGIDFNSLVEEKFDSPLGLGSSAGLIFGNTGGVCEAALRTAYFFLTGKNLTKDQLVFSSIRGLDGVKEAEVDIGGKIIKVAVANGMKNAKALIDKILAGEVTYHFVEVMNCWGGCIAGGGQPKITLIELENTKKLRMNGLYFEDDKATLRLCHENPSIKQIYNEFLHEPNSEFSEELLHTTYIDKSSLLGGKR